MRKIKLLLAIPDSADAVMLRTALAASKTLDIVGVTHSLTETYSLTENLRPDVILLERSLTLAAEFETMIALFEALETRWIVLRGRTANGAEARGAPPKGLLSRRIAPLTNVEGLEQRIVATKEMQRHSAGRKARASGTTEQINTQADVLENVREQP